MAVKLSAFMNDAQFSTNGLLLSGGKIETYLAGSTTPATTYTSSAGNVAQANPIILNTRGEVDNLIWLTTGIAYKFILKDSLNNVIRTLDNVTGVNDNLGTADQWVTAAVAPIFVAATQFTLAGDQTTIFEIGRRLKLTVTAGTVYGTILTSVFTTLTTITVVLDAGVLDSGLSSVQLGLITPTNSSLFAIQTGNLANQAVTTTKLAFDGGALGYRNDLINGNFEFSQEVGGSPNSRSDDTYTIDGWYALTQTAVITFIQQAVQENGTSYNIRLTQPGAAQRMGLAQIVESRDSRSRRGSAMVASLRIRASTSQPIRYAILEWTGAVDAVTSDVVLDWTSTSYAAGGFFSASNITVTAVGSITPVANTWTDVTPITGTYGSTVNNSIVMVWTEGTAATNFTLDVARFQLEKGTTKTAFEETPTTMGLNRCKRFWSKSYEYGFAAGSVTNEGVEVTRRSVTSEAISFFNTSFNPEMLIVPTVTFYNPVTGTAGEIRNLAANIVVTGVSATAPTTTKKLGAPTHASVGTAGDAVTAHWVASGRL